ncbi:MAG: RNA methyltransferase [Caldilineaceae bacterium]
MPDPVVAVYEFRQCTAAACRFRFPLPPAAQPADRCPRCGQPTVIAATVTTATEAASGATSHHPARVAVLDNVRSVFNVGSIFRCADGAGLTQLYLCGITPTPDHPKLHKTALGAEEELAWSYHPNSLDLVLTLRAEGYALWALEATAAAHSLFSPQLTLPPRLALIVGNENAGVDPDLLALSDQIVAIPMQGSKRSLNVAIAFGIAAFRLAEMGNSGAVSSGTVSSEQ